MAARSPQTATAAPISVARRASGVSSLRTVNGCLVYTSINEAFGRLDPGVCDRVGRPRALRYRLSRLVVSLLSRSQRSARNGHGHAPSRAAHLLLADGDA